MPGRVHLSTALLLGLGTIDLVTTLVWLNGGQSEGNPLFRALAYYGSVPFAVGKLALLVGPVLILEYARKSHPRSAEQGTWIALLAYAALYGVNLSRLLGR